MLRLFIALLLLFPSASAWADAGKLVGVWKLNSFVTEIVETKERRNMYGANPNGYLIITPERFMSIVTGEGASHH
jgi:hypothetical protein